MGAGSDDFTLDDHFVSSAANKISPAQLEERERQKAIRGIHFRMTVNTRMLRLWKTIQVHRRKGFSLIAR